MNHNELFAQLKSQAQFFSLRITDETADRVAVRKERREPFRRTNDCGAMLTAIDGGGYGYAATSDLSVSGLQKALDRASHWARTTAKRSVTDFEIPEDSAPTGRYVSPLAKPLPTPAELYDLLASEDAAAQIDARVVDSIASLEVRHASHRYLTSTGGDVVQDYHFVIPALSVTVSDGRDTQSRSLSADFCQQGGFEVVDHWGLVGGGRRCATEALDLLLAPNCPTGKMDLLLAPDQMMLQIHESIGHPLELDRILGDERNFAGTSFVTLDMFGTYQYGSPLLNVTFDPSVSEQFASYAFDDEGRRAKREYLIRAGMLVRPLGGALSQQRARDAGANAIDGVANARASNWNRAPIDRMANINVEPGQSTLAQLIENVEHGIMMRTNRSWSIDDSRNKFQFGCEWGQMIEHGRLTTIVKNPNYRGISANFWRSLKGVGDASTRLVMGTPYCGKGEPAQIIRVGHASPSCLFSSIDVFGGEA
jgi:predicted Zn-dependent protease